MREPEPTIETIRAAAERIAPHVHRTPVTTNETLDARIGASVFWKCENLQKAGAFKSRGACNAVFSLDEETAAAGVATHSSGNHGQALARAAARRGIPAHIVMPETAPAVKRAAVEGYGARVVPCAPTLAAREETLARVVAETGAHVVHPYDDVRVIAGQATAALELLEDAGPLDLVLAPVGGGGLLAGTALTIAAIAPGTRLVAAEPTGADDAARSLREGRRLPSIDPDTIADGLLTSTGELTFPIIQRLVAEIVTVDDAAIIAAMRLFWERTKLVIEPSSAVPVAALLEGKVDGMTGKRVGVILTGGNVDLGNLPW